MNKLPFSLGTLDKSKVDQYIKPHLSKRKRGPRPRVCVDQLVMLIHYRLKTGCQWRELPIKHFIVGATVNWRTVYYHFRKWCKDGSWRRIWTCLLRQYKRHLNLSSVQLDGSHTPCKGGGAAVGYQGRKATNTTNSLFMADDSGLIVAMSTPQDGAHHDVFQIEKTFKEMISQLEEAGINTYGVFLNADSGFDSDQFRSICIQNEIEANIKANPRNTKQQDQTDHYFDELLYKKRTAIERANA